MRSLSVPKKFFPELKAGMRVTVVVETQPGEADSSTPGSAELTYMVISANNRSIRLHGAENPRLIRVNKDGVSGFVFKKDGHEFPVTEITVV